MTGVRFLRARKRAERPKPPRPQPYAQVSDRHDGGDEDGETDRSTDLLLLHRAVHADTRGQLWNPGDFDLLRHHISPLDAGDPTKRKVLAVCGSAKSRRSYIRCRLGP